MAARRIMDVLSGKIVGPKSAAQPSCFREGRTDLRFFRLPFAVLQLRENLKKARSSYSVHRVGGSRGAPKIKVQVLVAVCRTPSLKPPRAQARGPSDDPVSLEPRRAADFFGFLWLFGYETRARGRTCVKPRQSSPGSKGNDRKHARAPFSAVRATRELKVDGFPSSRGALHDAHHEKTTKATTSPRPLGGDRWTPAPRCIFHHFCKCDTSQGVTPRLNFRFDRFFELLGCIFHHFCERYTNLGAPPHQNFCFHHFLSEF